MFIINEKSQISDTLLGASFCDFAGVCLERREVWVMRGVDRDQNVSDRTEWVRVFFQNLVFDVHHREFLDPTSTDRDWICGRAGHSFFDLQIPVTP